MADDLLKRLKDRYKSTVSAWEEQYSQSRDDVAFCDPENQWDSNVRNQREGQDRPCLVVDRMTPFIDQLANDQRQNRQSISVHPVDDHGDVDTADVIKGLIRHIEYVSNADIAYDTAFLSQVRGGIGYLRVYLDYCDALSFDQDIFIGRVWDPFKVYFDPNSVEPDGSDAMFAFIETDLAKDDYDRQFPDSDGASMKSADWPSRAYDGRLWDTGKNDVVRIVEYFEKVGKEQTLCLLPDGNVVLEKDVPEGVVPKAKRKTTTWTIRQVRANAIEVLDETIFPGEFIPIVPVYGQELVIDGKRQYSGLVRRLRDVQRMVNVWKSAQTEAIMLAPKAPWLIAKEAVEGYTREWANANNGNYAYLPYNATDIKGNLIPPPQRNVQEPAIGAINASLVGAEEDLKAVTGMYDPSLGNRGDSGQSGVAIRSLQHQGQVGNFHFQDNLSRSIRHLGRIILGIIPYVYSGPRTVRIVREDDTQKTVQINQQTSEKNPKTGEPFIYDLTTGKYDVTVTAGPSYMSRRAENLAVMMDLVRSLPPQQGMALADLIVSQMDTPIAKQLQDRLKKMLPPQLQDEQDGQPPVPPQVQAQMAQLHDQTQHYEAALNDAMQRIDELQEAADGKKLELESKERIAAMQAQVELAKLAATLDQKDALTLLGHEMAQIQQRLALIGQGQPIPEPEGTEEQPEPAMAGAPMPSAPGAMPTPGPGGAPLNLALPGAAPAGDQSPV